ncbi:MAG: hypothetical protein AB8E15_09770 [Bdellovibrionales bacterium]
MKFLLIGVFTAGLSVNLIADEVKDYSHYKPEHRKMIILEMERKKRNIESMRVPDYLEQRALGKFDR